MYITWTGLELDEPSMACPWKPVGATFAQAGQAGPGVASVPDFGGTWWSVLALWDDVAGATAAAPVPDGMTRSAWHVTLEPVSYRGDAHLAGRARPFDSLPRRGKVAGAAAVITLAGVGTDPQRTGEFLERFAGLGEDVARAPGHRAAMVQAAEDGAFLTFSAWSTLREAVTWAYHREEHSATVRRHQEHHLLDETGFLRCAVIASTGTLRGSDPLAGLTGTCVHHEETT